MGCKLCRERGKTWSGDAPLCAFGAQGKFKKLNWNCATMNALRDIANENESEHVAMVNDTRAAVIPFESDSQSGFIVLSWYKRRGSTGTAVVVNDDDAPRPLTERDALGCIAYHKCA